MGACYSKTGHDVSLVDKDKLPKEKRKKSFKNGHGGSGKKPKLVIDDCDSIQKDVSDTVYTEDSHFIQGTDIENCINKSQQTSLERLVRDFNAQNGDTSDFKDIDADDLEDEDVCDTGQENDVCQKDLSDLTEKLRQLDASGRDGKVSTSDSGIVMETCKGCDKLEQSCDVKHENSEELNPFIDSVDCETVPEPVEESGLSKPVNQTDCSCSRLVNNFRKHEKQTEHSKRGECSTHSFSRSFVNTSSESLLKSSLKKSNNVLRRKKRLSWKSADSLDYLDSMAISLDRTKSVCSSILGDDISLLHAPLATFDSLDFALGNSYDFSKHLGDNMDQNVQYSSDTFQFQFDFSGLEGYTRQSVTSVDRISESNKSLESTADLDKIQLAIRQLSVGTPTEHR